MITRPSKPILAAVVAAAGLLVSGLAASAQSGSPAGRLRCNVGAGLGLVVTSQRPMNCTFTPRRGPAQRYVGATAGASVGVGGSANLLVGGNNNEVTLQPLSLQGSRGINAALGVTGFELSLVEPGRGR